VPAAEALTAPKGSAGDRAVTDRFCEEVLRRRQPALSVLWLSEPDHTGHRQPLGGPEHCKAVAASDACFAQVLASVERYLGEDTLVLTGSDHGNETTDRVVPVEQLLVDAGLKTGLDSSDVVVAPQGTSALIYLATAAQARLPEVRRFLAGQDWVGSVAGSGELEGLGLRGDGALALAVSLRKAEESNPFGVPGLSDLMLDRHEDLNHVGCGQHGGLGRWEMRPFLMARGPGFSPGTSRADPTRITDIAPTILQHLGLPADGMDGVPLQNGSARRPRPE
jgi:arylsulfatase A-like enzyme